MKTKFLAAMLSTTLLQGCASFWSDAEDTPTCGGASQGIGCTPVSDVRKIVSGPNYLENIAAERAAREAGKPSPYYSNIKAQAEKKEEVSSKEKSSRAPWFSFGKSDEEDQESKAAKVKTANGFYEMGNNSRYVMTVKPDLLMQVWIAPHSPKSGESADEKQYSSEMAYVRIRQKSGVGVEDPVTDDLK